MAKKLKAYQVSSGYEDATIRFATNSATARRQGANEIGCDWQDIDTCRRAPQYDQYAPGPIPPEVLIEEGWSYECRRHRCNNEVTRDVEERVFAGNGEPYCCEACMAQAFAYQRSNEAAQAALVDLVLAHHPDAVVTHIHVYGERLSPRRDGSMCAYADFALPGIKHGVRQVFGDDFVLLHADDVDAYETMRVAHQSKGEKP